ncbi:sugar transferase [Natrononativus amylolyticus]|uniref:sugar transferase n=1 Tax=Natrononativus amylolyticus TaxID=2963434 RepID=UPI0020CF9C51|nr:sugar transferase [Natrononativus amylolyticus]
MLTGWRYRAFGGVGAVLIVIAAVLLANQEATQVLFTTYVPVFNNLDPEILEGEALAWAAVLSVLAIGLSLIPLYKPQPRRFLDTVFFTQKRVVVGGLALATLGYFNWSYRLPRATLTMTIGFLVVALPAWFVWIRLRPSVSMGRTVIVGDDVEQIQRVIPEVDSPIIGYLCPTIAGTVADDHVNPPVTDGGTEPSALGDTRERSLETVTEEIDELGRIGALPRLGGLSRLEDALVEYDVDTVVLAFRRADRAEFFGALDACHEHGVNVKVHRDYADSVLVADGEIGELVDVDLEPWDPQDHLFKRAFDIVFAWVGLVALFPAMVVIAVAIKLDSPGPILYSQERTAGFGETFPIYKFRTMVPEGESATPTEDEDNDRITRVGRLLRKTHLDELPQLWSIFVGDMSVVGPRAAWTDEEMLLEQEAASWRKRWFVKPGLTGLAQVNDAKSTNPQAKLRYDLEYISKQSFWFDMKIVIRQLWNVVVDVTSLARPAGDETTASK